MNKQSGFAVVEALLVVVIVAILGFTGWFVWHAKQNTDQILKDTTSSQPGIVSASKVTDFASCKTAKGSVLQETYPEQCVTKDGKHFSDSSASQRYLTIKEWGVRVPLSATDEGAYYKIATETQQSTTDPTNLTVYATDADQLTGPAGVSCKGEYIAYLLRLPSSDPAWQPSVTVDDGNVSPLFGQRIDIGSYRYALATKKEYGPECWETNTTGNYDPDAATSEEFGAIVNAFTTDFKNIEATD